MKKLNDARNKNNNHSQTDMSAASDDMIMFAVFNCASLQVISTTPIALLSAAGSENVSGVIPAIWICSVLTTLFAVVMTKILAFLSSKFR